MNSKSHVFQTNCIHRGCLKELGRKWWLKQVKSMHLFVTQRGVLHLVQEASLLMLQFCCTKSSWTQNPSSCYGTMRMWFPSHNKGRQLQPQSSNRIGKGRKVNYCPWIQFYMCHFNPKHKQLQCFIVRLPGWKLPSFQQTWCITSHDSVNERK